jgi:hypothetical protein
MSGGAGTGTPVPANLSPDYYTANIPAGIKAAMTMICADLFKYRETISPVNLTEVPAYASAERLLARHTVHFFA